MCDIASKVSPNNHVPNRRTSQRQHGIRGARDPRIRSTMETYQVGLYFLSNSFLMKAATSCVTRSVCVLVGNLHSHAHAAFRVTVDDDRSNTAKHVTNFWTFSSVKHQSRLSSWNVAYLFNVVLAEGLRCTVDSVLLHLLRHVGVLDDCLSLLRHD
jgi:hypothetical protein